MNLYFYYGEEDFAREQNILRLLAQYPLQNPSVNFIKISNSNLDKFIENCEQMPFFDEKKVILAQNTELFSSTSKKIPQGLSDEIMEYLQKLPDYAVVIFNEDNVDKRMSNYKKISKIAECKEETYREITDLSNMIERQAKADIDSKTATYLAEKCGPSMRYLYTELDKLIILNKEGEKITPEIIDAVCMKSAQGIIFDLTDSVGARNTGKTLTLINELVAQKQAEQYLLIMIYKHVRNLYLIKAAQEEGKATAEELKMNPYVFRKASGQSKNFNSAELKSLLFKLSELDEKTKKSTMDIKTGLDTILSEVL